ncbi:hypothetical protein Maq22A_c04785 [Methylobacterium aquaticum]|uniref:Uncharacterized protein n=2 Tax=Methylobacterium aquaticum TaxID=270351 RepID=A0A0C6F7Q3_9HYPH|nr:hypothetical protein Maq22A_c04785 [Methylobacterium aquaticum]
MLGVILIALIGYGTAALLFAMALQALADGVKATTKSARREERNAFYGGIFLALAMAGVTRWLLGGAL